VQLLLFATNRATGTCSHKAIILTDDLHQLLQTPSERFAECRQLESGSEDIILHRSEDDFSTSFLLLATEIGPPLGEPHAAHQNA